MEWKSEYSIGIPEIDDQHKQLLDCFTNIEESIRSNQSWADTHYAIVNLTQVARLHFSFEEAMMRLFGYPELDAHCKEHHAFFDRLEHIEMSSLRNSAEVEMIQFLFDWLKSHILGTDKTYAAHIFSGAEIVTTT